jgi:hypothetical protein
MKLRLLFIILLTSFGCGDLDGSYYAAFNTSIFCPGGQVGVFINTTNGETNTILAKCIDSALAARAGGTIGTK